MRKKIAIVTQSYKNDYNECRLLCESMDRFVSGIDHFIFVNDDDYELFQTLNYGRHKVHKKGEILPWYMIRIPWKILGHHFHVSIFTIPVREWIIQQICKFGVFEVIGDEYEVVFNIDSETVFMKPFAISMWVNEGKYMMYRAVNDDEPSHDDYCHAAEKLLKWDKGYKTISMYNYMNTPVCFVRENLKALLSEIGRNYWMKSWKLALCNTYRFSEYYTYGIYTDYILDMKNHYLIDYHVFPQIDISECPDIDDFKAQMKKTLSDSHAVGLWLQKKARKSLSDKYLDFNSIYDALANFWEGC